MLIGTKIKKIQKFLHGPVGSMTAAKTFKLLDHQILLLYTVCYLPLLECPVKFENKLITRNSFFDFIILLEDIAQ